MLGLDSTSILSNQIKRRPPFAPGATTRPKLLDNLRKVLRSCHYIQRTEKIYCQWVTTVQEMFGHEDVKTTMIHTHVLDKGGHGVLNSGERP